MNTKRHLRDKVDSLIKMNGFYLKMNGRSGTIYFVKDGKLCEIDCEMSGVKKFDIIIYSEGLLEWVLPEKLLIHQDERKEIIECLKFWLDKQGVKYDL